MSKFCKNYLKRRGLLLANNSHGDASIAILDREFSLIGVLYRANKRLYLTKKDLDAYFIPKKKIEITVEYLERTMKGVEYKKQLVIIYLKKINKSFQYYGCRINLLPHLGQV